MPDNSSITTVTYVRDVTHKEENRAYIEVQFQHFDGGQRNKLYERRLIGSPAKLRDALLNDGALKSTVDPAAIKRMCKTPPNAHSEITSRTGWHGSAFVYPGQTFGKEFVTPELDPRLFSDRSKRSAGSLVAWCSGLKVAIKYSDYLLLACCLAPAAALLELIGESEGFGFHLHGTGRSSDRKTISNSSSGKTTTARVAISLIESPAALPTFQLTDRRLDEHLAARNNLVAAFDEEGVGSVSLSGPQMNIGGLAYKMANGVSAMRSRVVHSLPDLHWCLIGLTTGETPLDLAARPRREGESVRLIALPVPPGTDGGIFNRHEKFSEEIAAAGGLSTIASAVNETIGLNFGVTMPAFLEVLASDPEKFALSARKTIERFVADVATDGAPWDKRFAKRFGILLAAATLMAEHEIGPWMTKRARAGFRRLHSWAYQAVRGPASLVKSSLDRTIAALDDGSFPRVKKGNPIPPYAAGCQKRISGEWRICIKLENLKKFLATDIAPVITQWDEYGVLARSGDGKRTKQLKIGGTVRERYVVLRVAELRRLSQP